MLQNELQGLLEQALTALELDQEGCSPVATVSAYAAAASRLRYVTDSLLSEQDPLLWTEACRQVQAVLEDRIQVRTGIADHLRRHGKTDGAKKAPQQNVSRK